MKSVLKAPFVEIPIPSELKNDANVKLFKTLVEREFLIYWKIGTKHGRISSKFETNGGTEDILTSPIIDDCNYHYLLKAHLQRAFQLIKEEN